MATATRITAAQLERWHTLNQRRLALEREARQLDKERELLSAEFKAALEAEGKTALTRGRYRLALVDGRPSVGWKDEFVRHVGAEEAARLLAQAPVPKRVDVSELKAA